MATTDPQTMTSPLTDTYKYKPAKQPRDMKKETGKQDMPTPAVSENENVPVHNGKSNWNKPFGFYMAFLSLLLTVLLVSLDSTALAVAIPTMIEQLRGTTLEAFWASISFMLAVTIVQPIYTTTSDILGRKIPLYSGFILFFLGSIVFAVGQNMPTVIAGRVVQGLGGGGLDVLSEVIVTDMTTLKERSLWIGLLAVPMALGSILGPIIGALLTERVTWRWIGWINLPLIGVAIVLAFFYMKLKAIEESFLSKLRRLDWMGMAIFATGAILFSLPLSWAGAMYPWGSWRTLLPFIIGILLLVGFAIYERFPAHPTFPSRIFGNITAQVTLLGAFMHGAALYASLVYLPLYFQAVFLETPLEAAVSILPFCVFVVVLSGVAAIGVEYTRRLRWEIWLGWILLAVGAGLMSLWDNHTSLAESVSFQVIAGIGVGVLFTVPTIAIQASAPSVEDQGLAIGIHVSFRLFGGLIGLAVGATAFSSVFGEAISGLRPLPQQVSILDNPAEAVGFIPLLREVSANLPQNVQDTITDAYGESFRAIWYSLAGMSAFGGIASIFMKELSVESEETGRQHWQEDEKNDCEVIC